MSLTCRDTKADKKKLALATPPATLRVRDTNHSPNKIQGTGVMPMPESGNGNKKCPETEVKALLNNLLRNSDVFGTLIA